MTYRFRIIFATGWLVAGTSLLVASPRVTRLTPPSALFSFGDANPPITSRFLPGQRFDLQATIEPDAGQTIVDVEFFLDAASIGGATALSPATVPGRVPGTTVGSLRAFSHAAIGVHRFSVRATQSDGAIVDATGNFEIVNLSGSASGLARARNIIVLIGDGMGVAHRTAARIVSSGVSQGKVIAPLAMDQFPVTGLVHIHSLNTIVTDSAAGAAVYSTGNKHENYQEGVFPDDTVARFDNPRIENLGEYLARTQGKALGIVTTADVADATPAAFGIHSQDRGAGTGICDQYLDETAVKANLRVLLGGGLTWFLPAGTPGSSRDDSTDYVLPGDLAASWRVVPGALDARRDLIADFRAAGFTYARNASELNSVGADTQRLLGLFHYSHMSSVLDRVDGRRGNSGAVASIGFPDQPMLEEMTDKALKVLGSSPNGFVLMVEGASIDKLAHAMETDRWILEAIEFDHAIERVRQYVLANPDTLALITADHETGGVGIIGASMVTGVELQRRVAAGGGTTELRDAVVGTYGGAGFPFYRVLADGFPLSMDVDGKLLVGYAANADRKETWLANRPSGGGGFFATGQVPGGVAVHTASDVQLSAMGTGATLFSGVMDNTDVFFKVAQAAVAGVAQVIPGAGAAQDPAASSLVNLSTRGYVGTGEQMLIAGFVIRGTQPRTVLVRAAGPSLAGFGLHSTIADPQLRIVDAGGSVLYFNQDWEAGGDVATLRDATSRSNAFPFPSGSRDAAVVVTLAPGNYTVQVTGNGSTSGVALVEVYDVP